MTERRATTTQWRARLRAVRTLLAEAEATRGKQRRDALVRAAQAFRVIEAGELPGARRYKGRYALICDLDRQINRLSGVCTGCLASGWAEPKRTLGKGVTVPPPERPVREAARTKRP